MIKAVFFDLGDTIHDEQSAIAAAIANACDYAVTQSPGITVTGLGEAYLRELRDAEQETRRWTATRAGPATGIGLGHRLWERALEKCGVASPILAHAVACHYELSRMRALKLLPDALPALQGLQGRVRTGVIAEGSPGIVGEELTLLDLRELLSLVVVDQEVGYLKRDPQLFLHAVREAGCEPGEAAHVGDSLESDVAPAHEAGLLTVWVNRAGAAPPADAPAPDYTIPDLASAPELLLGIR